MSILDLQVDQKPLEMQSLQARMRDIKQKLVDGTPGIIDAMIDVHTNLQQHEELVLLLDDNDIKMLHQAHEKHKHVMLIQKEVKAAKKTTKKDLANIKASDL